ncbi:hypothetical protein [Candidatus Nitrosocosmicus hydrocola]|uniref:hypothetical protein n=1 Tax=Candidatus Nitrosocosmicus hydrocola TaxID=1826872 RepID=UPI0013731BF4|nr:hypothetical protein [Candidatus Nitrosocosmicus hydrocola]
MNKISNRSIAVVLLIPILMMSALSVGSSNINILQSAMAQASDESKDTFSATG